jgi:hypothetical protein
MQAKLPTSATNLSRSFAPTQASVAQTPTMKKRKKFFFHLTYGLYLPVLYKVSTCRIDGIACGGLPAEELLARDLDGWIQLQWCRKEDSKRVNELNAVYKLIVLRHIQDDDGLRLRAESRI